MNFYSLKWIEGLIYIELDEALWILDTGSPGSFGSKSSASICGQTFKIPSSYMGISISTIGKHAAPRCVGLLGMDILGQFDSNIDLSSESIEISTEKLICDGIAIQLETASIEGLEELTSSGVPVIDAHINGRSFRVVFDTGAEISYLQDDVINSFPEAGRFKDFYPGFGDFDADTYRIGLTLESEKFFVRCGKLPPLLGIPLTTLGVQGIVGNEILKNRKVGFFPRRNLMII